MLNAGWAGRDESSLGAGRASSPLTSAKESKPNRGRVSYLEEPLTASESASVVETYLPLPLQLDAELDSFTPSSKAPGFLPSFPEPWAGASTIGFPKHKSGLCLDARVGTPARLALLKPGCPVARSRLFFLPLAACQAVVQT